MNLEVKNTAVQFLIKQIRVKGTEKEEERVWNTEESEPLNMKTLKFRARAEAMLVTWLVT